VGAASNYLFAATHCNIIQHAVTRCNSLQHAATRCNTLQNAATRCNTLQHTRHAVPLHPRHPRQ